LVRVLRARIDINLEIYTSGIRDALGGKDSQMNQEEIRATITSIQQRLMAAQQKVLKEKAAKNLEEGKKFLAENQKKEGVKTLLSGLQYKVLIEGSGKTPRQKIRYR